MIFFVPQTTEIQQKQPFNGVGNYSVNPKILFQTFAMR